MSIKINFDVAHNPENPTLILARKNGDKLGQINAKSIEASGSLNDYSEISFNVHKYIDGELCDLWEEITNFKLIYCIEWDMWFEITVELDESNQIVKTVFATQLGQAELSQIMLYSIEINTENDIAREDYKLPTVLYNPSYPESSLLHRIMEKAQHYTVIHVDSTIATIQRTFSFDDISLYDALQEIAEELHCLFIFNSNSDENGKIQRTISVYDLESNCNECGYRGEFTKICPECGSLEINEGYGVDTNILITADELGDNIQFTTNTDAVKNCFKLEGGDDLMTATIRNCNPNGTDYIWYISDNMKSEMSKDLVSKINSYDELYNYYQKDYVALLDNTTLNNYNNLIEQYKTYNEKLEKIVLPIQGYSSLMNVYYNTVDFYYYLNNELMPNAELQDTNAIIEAAKLTSSALSPVAVTNVAVCSTTTANSAVLAMAKVIIDARYQIKINDGIYNVKEDGYEWVGNFIVTNYSDENDTCISEIVTVVINEDYEEYIKQKLEKSLNDKSNDEYSIVMLFDDLTEEGLVKFKSELKKYCLKRLNSFNDSCQACIDILIEQGIGSLETWDGETPNLYNDLYLPYYKRKQAIETEISLRESEITMITRLQTIVEKERNQIQSILNFENYLNSEDLWLEFCAFRREDKYSNENYISDGLNNAEIFNKANEFISIAQKEIYKSSELQHTITTTLKNLLTIEKFESLINDFQLGNWLRIIVDDVLYKLRLLKYTIDYENLNNISVEFSDVVTSKNSIKSIQDIISQATSMATSYNSVKRQAEQGEQSNKLLNDWTLKGLDATNTKIIGGADKQTQIWDEHGMLFKKYDSITDTYDDIQLKIINSTIAITDDNWQSVKTALGSYYYFHPITHKLTRAYGLNGEILIGKIILGEQLAIYNKNNNLTFNEDGFEIFNENNSFTVNPNSDTLLSLTNRDKTLISINEDGSLHIECEDIKGIIKAINLSAEEASIKADKISLEGLVTANSNFKILTDGSVEINSGSITTTATYTDYSQKSLLNSGALTFYRNDTRHGRIDAGIMTDGTKTLGLITESDTIISFGKFTDSRVIIHTQLSQNGDLDLTGKITTTGNISTDGKITSYGSITTESSLFVTSGYGLKLKDDDGNSWLIHFDYGTNLAEDIVKVGSNSRMTSLFSSDNKIWSQGSATNYFTTSSDSSDKRLKTEISDLSVYENFFTKIRPVAYKFHEGLYNPKSTEAKINWGFYAQDVLSAYEENEIDWTKESFLNIKDTELTETEKEYIDDNILYQLSYQNMIALNTHMIQKALKNIQVLNENVEQLKKMINTE